MAARFRPATKEYPAWIVRAPFMNGTMMPRSVGTGVTCIEVIPQHVRLEPAIAAGRALTAGAWLPLCLVFLGGVDHGRRSGFELPLRHAGTARPCRAAAPLVF